MELNDEIELNSTFDRNYSENQLEKHLDLL
jgi:hypothetical protein